MQYLSRAIGLLVVTAWWATVAPVPAASAAEILTYTNVVTIAGVDPEERRLIVHDGWRGQFHVTLDDGTDIQDARGNDVALAALEPWDRVVVDSREEPRGSDEDEAISATRIQLVIGSVGAYRSDETAKRRDSAVRERVVERLAASRTLQGSDVWVSVAAGQATLRGLVADDAAKRRAVEIARRTSGVRSVTDELRTDPTIAEWAAIQIEDEVLAKAVAERLVARAFTGARLEEDWLFGWEIEGPSFEIDVDADMGTVTLSGSVPSPEDEEWAIRVARRTEGVRSVRSTLESH